MSAQPHPSAVDERTIRQFATYPLELFDNSWHRMHTVEPRQMDALQLAAARLRFAELRDRVPVLTAMADELGLHEIDQLDDLVPLLFQHSIYKSYPTRLLERNSFDALTRWLDRLTTIDLSGASVDGCDGIDSWLDALDEQTDARVAYSSGTSGTMSFFSRSEAEWDRMIRAMRAGLHQFPPGEHVHVVWPAYRHGRTGFMRAVDYMVEHFAGSEERFHVLHPGAIGGDAMFLAARLRVAEARGEVDRLEVGPSLTARRQELEEAQRHLADAIPRFLDEVLPQLDGERVWVFGTWKPLHDLASAGLERGMQDVFGPGSVVTTAGGMKGMPPPDDWEARVARFAGIDGLNYAFGMTELMAISHACDHGRYHLGPEVVLFVLDPEDGTLLPRTGSQTGRAAYFDLMAETYWGGLITGDEVTVDWSPCGCGLTTPHLSRRIERYSEKRGGTDKITCAGADEAHRAALDFLVDQSI
jgi:hypothetical protein